MMPSIGSYTFVVEGSYRKSDYEFPNNSRPKTFEEWIEAFPTAKEILIYEYNPEVDGNYEEYIIDYTEAFIGSSIKIIAPIRKFIKEEDFKHAIAKAVIPNWKYISNSLADMETEIINHLLGKFGIIAKLKDDYRFTPLLYKINGAFDSDKWCRSSICIPIYQELGCGGYKTGRVFTITLSLDHFINHTNYDLLSDWTKQKVMEVYKSFLPAHLFERPLTEAEKTRIAISFFNKTLQRKCDPTIYRRERSKSIIS